MADTKIRVRPATAQLKQDHRAVRKLFGAFEELREDEELRAAELFNALRRELEIHAQLEEEIFYPAVQVAANGEGARLVRGAFESHLVARRLLGVLESLTPGGAGFREKLRELEDQVLRHAEDEEVEMFQVFGDLPRDEREDVAERIALRRRELSGEE